MLYIMLCYYWCVYLIFAFLFLHTCALSWFRLAGQPVYNIFFFLLQYLATKNRINGTQRTEQSEVYGTKKEEKREKRRKLVQYFVPKCSYYLCPGTYLKWCQNPNFNTYTGYFSIQFFDCYFMVQIVKYSDFP